MTRSLFFNVLRILFRAAQSVLRDRLGGLQFAPAGENDDESNHQINAADNRKASPCRQWNILRERERDDD